MHSFGTREAADSTRRYLSVNDFAYHKSEWMETGKGSYPSPMVVLVEQAPGSLLRPHFHRQNQFQLFVRGSGQIGSHALGPYMLHYAGAYTGYGPIQAGPEGLAYLTLRASWDEGAGFLPEARPALAKGPKAHAVSPAFMPGGKPDSGMSVRRLIGERLDAVGAELVAMHAGHAAALPVDKPGMFIVIVDGSCTVFGRRMQLLEQLYVTADEAPLQIVAGDHGCEFVTMTMPELDASYRGPLAVDLSVMTLPRPAAVAA